MRCVLFALVLSLIGLAPAARADDAPEAFGALAGGWGRFVVLHTKEGKDFRMRAMVASKDGKDGVFPELRFIGERKAWKLLICGAPGIVYWNPMPTPHDLVVPEGAKKGELAIVVPNQVAGGWWRRGGNSPFTAVGASPDRGLVRFKYTIEKDILTITCKEKVPAGPWLGDYDISGRWARQMKGYGPIE